MNTSQQQIRICKSHNTKQVWNKKTTVSYHSYTTLLPQNNLQLHIKYCFEW